MNTTRQKPLILLLELSESKVVDLTKILQANNYTVERASNVSNGIQKAIELIPDLIICNYKLSKYDGFQAYNLFENSILKKGIPFIVVMDKFIQEEVELGLDLGIDNFIFLPFQEERILNKINTSLKKVKEHNTYDKELFNRLFEDSPIGMFIMCNNQVERANKVFYNVIGVSSFDFDKVNPWEFFITEGREKDEAEFYNCFKGLIKHCCLKELQVKNREKMVDMHVSHFGNVTNHRIFIQLIESQPEFICYNNENEWHKDLRGHLLHTGEKQEVGLLTVREAEIANLSAQGLPIKQIADVLKISARTVEKHRSNIMQKTSTNSILEASIKMQKLGLSTLE